MCSGVFCDPVYVLLEMVHLECVGQWVSGGQLLFTI